MYGASANTDDGYGFSSGTSASAPIAAGVGALLLSAYPHLKNTQIRSIFLKLHQIHQIQIMKLDMELSLQKCN